MLNKVSAVTWERWPGCHWVLGFPKLLEPSDQLVLDDFTWFGG